MADLCLADLDLSQQKLVVRDGKGMKDRTMYLTEATISALKAYLAVRGTGPTDHVFLYRHKPLCKDLVRRRLLASGKRTNVKVSPHRLRHTFATQLVNAGCRITTLQALLGHKHINTTMTYARVHNHTVAEDYYAAMARVEKRLELHLQPPTAVLPKKNGDSPNVNAAATHLLTLATALQTELLPENQQAVVVALRHGLRTLVETANGTSKQLVVNEQLTLRQPVVGVPP